MPIIEKCIEKINIFQCGIEKNVSLTLLSERILIFHQGKISNEIIDYSITPTLTFYYYRFTEY